MNKINIKVIANPGAVVPEYKTAGAAGAEHRQLFCAFSQEFAAFSGKMGKYPPCIGEKSMVCSPILAAKSLAEYIF